MGKPLCSFVCLLNLFSAARLPQQEHCYKEIEQEKNAEMLTIEKYVQDVNVNIFIMTRQQVKKFLHCNPHSNQTKSAQQSKAASNDYFHC